MELDRQVPLMDEIDEKVDRAASGLKSTNARLKDTVTQLRSSHNFCIDIILLCILLGIAAYLYNVLLKMEIWTCAYYFTAALYDLLCLSSLHRLPAHPPHFRDQAADSSSNPMVQHQRGNIQIKQQQNENVLSRSHLQAVVV
ncbi:hypothetical protein Ancab_036946 [Ancistrocladus abbreviatus]